MRRLLMLTALAACGGGDDDDESSATTHGDLAAQIGCSTPHEESYPGAGEVQDCTINGETVHLRIFESNDDRDADIEMITEICEAFNTGDDVTVFEGDRWLINAEMSTEVSRSIAKGLDVEPEEVEC